jgi:hypothetical protein
MPERNGPIIEAQDLTFRYPTAQTSAVDGLCFGIERSPPSPGGRTSSAVSCGHGFPSIKTQAVRIDTTMDQHP